MESTKKKKAVGIDLGTTNSCVAVFEGDEYVVLQNSEDKFITPSCIYFALDPKTGNLTTTIGENAQKQAYLYPKDTIYVFKRFIGKKFDEVKDLAKTVPYEVVRDNNGDAAVKVHGKVLSFTYITALYLQALIKDIKTRVNYEIEDVVITTPAGFDTTQKDATKNAAQIAKLNVLRIINEPTASVMAYGSKRKDITGNVLVYDFGGGTFDVSLVNISKSVDDGDENVIYDVSNTEGDMFLGGEDIDNAITEYVINEFEKTNKVKLDPSNRYRVQVESKKAKELLSKAMSAQINVLYIHHEHKHINTTITRSWFDDKITPLINRTMEITKRIYDTANDKVECILLIGGSSRIPLVRTRLESMFTCPVNSDISPDVAVAIGAACQASILSGDQSGILLIDITPMDIGIETVGGIMTPIITRGSRIPCEDKKIFSTASDNQTTVEIRIFTGNRKMIADCREIHKLKLHGLKPMPRGVPQIEVKMAIDAAGLLTFHVQESSSNISQTVNFTISDKLTSEEIDRLVKEAEEQKERDEIKYKEAQLRIEIDNITYEIKAKTNKINDVDKKSEFEKKFNTISDEIGLTTEKIYNSNSEELEAATNSLRTLLQEILNYLATVENNQNNTDNSNTSDTNNNNPNTDSNQDNNQNS